jgi:hypothetical protein
VGDLITLLDHLNLSPLNTFLLVGLFWFLRSIYQRIERLEKDSIEHGTAIAIIEARLTKGHERH